MTWLIVLGSCSFVNIDRICDHHCLHFLFVANITAINNCRIRQITYISFDFVAMVTLEGSLTKSDIVDNLYYLFNRSIICLYWSIK